jgi:hypothetical protein
MWSGSAHCVGGSLVAPAASFSASIAAISIDPPLPFGDYRSGVIGRLGIIDERRAVGGRQDARDELKYVGPILILRGIEVDDPRARHNEGFSGSHDEPEGETQGQQSGQGTDY